MSLFSRLILFVAALVLAGCSTMKIDDFKSTEPRLQIEDYFAGRTVATGLFEDRFGKVRRRFTVEIEGTWDGETLTLDERFLYDDGETERRVWVIRKTAEGVYEGRADGVVGIARGRQAGSALHWEYKFDLKVKDDTWRVHFDDWMFLMPGEVMINRAIVTKWGFELGRVLLAFHKPAVSAAKFGTASPLAAE